MKFRFFHTNPRISRLLICVSAVLFLSTPRERSGQDGANSPRLSVVKITVLRRVYGPRLPYLIEPKLETIQGAGLVIRNKYIVTDGELTRDAANISISFAEEKKSWTARVAFQGFDSGLSLLRVNEESFYSLAKPLEEFQNELPRLGENLSILGFDRNGSLAHGNFSVSLIKRTYLHDSDADRRRLIFPQEGSRLPGYKFQGAPVLRGGKLVGVYRPAKTPYLVHVSALNHFLEDIKDNRYDGFPHPGFFYSPLIHPVHRRAAGLSEDDSNGVLIRRFSYFSPGWRILEPDDALLSLNGHVVNSRGNMNVDGRVMELSEYIASRGPEALSAEVRRSKNTVQLTLRPAPSSSYSWRRRRSNEKRPYFISAGIVFQELDYELFHDGGLNGDPLIRYRYLYYYEDRLNEQSDRDIILTSRLPDPANDAVRPFLNGVVEFINGRRVRNLRDFAKEWNSSQGRYIALQFMNRALPLLIPREKIKQTDKRIREKYDIRARSNVEQ